MLRQEGRVQMGAVVFLIVFLLAIPVIGGIVEFLDEHGIIKPFSDSEEFVEDLEEAEENAVAFELVDRRSEQKSCVNQ